jgi:hypothetical protein
VCAKRAERDGEQAHESGEAGGERRNHCPLIISERWRQGNRTSD